MDASYLFSYVRGNWSGIASSDEAIQSLQPNSGRSFNLLYYSYDAQGNPTIGRLGTDRPHEFKLQGTYDLPWGTMVGMNYLLESGVPRSTIASQKNINFFPNGRGDLGRTPTFSQVDLLLQQDVRLSRSLRVSIGVNAINVFDQKIETTFIGTPYRDQFNVDDATFFGGFNPSAVASSHGFRPDACFGKASGYQGARAVRLQAKLMF